MIPTVLPWKLESGEDVSVYNPREYLGNCGTIRELFKIGVAMGRVGSIR